MIKLKKILNHAYMNRSDSKEHPLAGAHSSKVTLNDKEEEH